MFILKKIVTQFFLPLPFCLLLQATGIMMVLLTRRKKAGRAVAACGWCLFLAFSLRTTSDRMVVGLEERYPPFERSMSPDGSAAVAHDMVPFVVVLGGGHNSNGWFPITSQIGESSLYRLVEGIRIHRTFAGSKLVLSGGAVFDDVANARVMADLARQLGVEDTNIILEDRSRDTRHEAVLLHDLLAGHRFALVTEAAHMPRSIGLFRKVGLAPIPAPTNHHVLDTRLRSPADFFPSSTNLRKSERAIHERLGILWSRLRGYM